MRYAAKFQSHQTQTPETGFTLESEGLWGWKELEVAKTTVAPRAGKKGRGLKPKVGAGEPPYSVRSGALSSARITMPSKASRLLHTLARTSWTGPESVSHSNLQSSAPSDQLHSSSEGYQLDQPST